MTSPNTPPELEPQTQQSQPPRRVWLGAAMTIFGVSVLGLGIVGYFGLDYWIRRKLPPLLDKQLSEFINREVKVGEIKSWSLGGVRLENSSIPATQDDPNYVKAKAIDIRFNAIAVLFTQTLPLRINLIEPDVYIEEDKQGEWVRLNLSTQEEGELPFDVDAKVNFRKAKVAVFPQALKTPFAISQINGFLNYNQNQPLLLRYGINAPVVRGKVDIDGETQLQSWRSVVNAKIDKLSLADLSNYVKDNIPVRIPSGELNADLAIALPSLSELPSVRGTANLQGLQVKSPQLKVPLNATANLRFDGKKVSFKETRGSYGGLIASVFGNVDLDNGFDLKVETNSFGIGSLIKTTSIKSPINIDGNLQAELLLKGDAKNPILLGNVVSKRGIIVDKTVFSQVNTVFGGNLQQVILKEFRATPATGGDILASGEVSFPKSLPEVKDFSKSKLAFVVDADIPNTQAIVAPYGVTNDVVKLGKLSADGEVNGTIANPNGVLSWKLPQAEADIVGQVSGGGEVKLVGNQVSLDNTSLRTAEGKVDIDGGANLATNNWNAAVNANSLALNPFLAKVENVGERIKQTPIFLRGGKVQLAGSLNNFDPASIRGDIDLNLNVDRGSVVLNGNLSRGRFLANANAAGIGLNKIVPELPTPVTLANSRVKLSGAVDELVDLDNLDNLDNLNNLDNFDARGIRGDFDLNLNVNRGNVAVNGNLNRGILSANANAAGIGLNKIVPELPIAVTLANSRVKVSGAVNELINFESIDNLDSFRASVDGNLVLPEVKGRNRVDFNGEGNFATKNWNLVANANSLSVNSLLSALSRKEEGRRKKEEGRNGDGELNPYLEVNVNQQLNQKITLRQGNVKLAGNLDIINDFDIAKVNGNADLNLSVNKGRLAVNGNLNRGIIQANVNANEISANEFLPELPIPVTVANTQVNLAVALKQLVQLELIDDSIKPDKLNSFRATAKGRLILPRSEGDINFNAKGDFADNNLQAFATARGILLNQLFPDSPLPVTVNNTQLNITGKINQLLDNNFDNINADVAANLGVAKGSVRAIANLRNGKIASNVNANNVNIPLVCRSFDISCAELEQLSAKLNLTGEVKPLLEGNPILIQANRADITTQQQELNAKGKIVVIPGNNKTSSWNVATDLNVDVNSNLAKLPLQSIAQQLNSETIPIQGKANFSGRLIGRNLISEPFTPGNLRLAGNLIFKNLAVDKISFQPVLAGPVDVNLGNSIELDLRSKSDRIAANLQPCNRKDCLSPYLPTFFDFQQGVNTQNPIILNGRREGDVLDIDLKNASLSLLNLLPVVEETIGTTVGGTASGNLDVNLFNLATAGNINIDTPAIGAVTAKKFAADFSYDGEIARVDAATLLLGKTRYAFNGGFNLNSGDINGKLVADSAKVEDIFAAVKIFNLEDLQSGVDGILNPEYGNAADVQVKPLPTKPNSTILQQLFLFAEIIRSIQQQAALKQEENSIGFDIQGEYDAQVAVAGKLTNPQINFQLQGDNWQWQPQTEYVKVDKNKGVVVKPNQSLDINKIVAQGSYKDGIIQIQPVQIAAEGGLIALNGTFPLNKTPSSGLVQIQNLPIELAQRFVELPLDVNGKFNLQAQIGGNLFKPEIQQGAFSLAEGTINQKPLGEFAGNFNYIDSIAKLNTTPNSILKIDASVAYPLQQNKNNPVAVKAKIDNQAFALLDAFTQGEVQWLNGNGEIAIAIDGELNPQADTIQGLLDNLIAKTTIQIENATIKTLQLDNKIKLTAMGSATLNNQTIQVQEISGSLAESPFTITGNLPLFQAIANTQPLNIVLGPGDIKLKGLYKGGIAADIKIARTAINPVIAGELALEKGRVFIPKSREQQSDNTQQIKNQSKKVAKNQIATQAKQLNKPSQTNNLPINPTFQNFQITLGRGFRFTQTLPRVNFRMAGGFTINGGLNNLQGNGKIELKRGSLFLLDNPFFITRDRQQVVTFLPSRSLLNPQLDIELQTTVVDAPNFDRLQPIDSEIRDDIVAPTNPEQIDVRILVQGEANQLLASLSNNSSSGDACQAYQKNIRVSGLGKLIPNSPTELEKFTNCININSKVAIQTRGLLENPAVILNSTPSRNNSEILSLLGNRTFAALQRLEQQITGGDEAELLESLVLDYIVTPLQTEITQDVLWQVQRPVNSLGKSIGLTRLQVFPALTGLKDINPNSSARFVYDYEAGEFRLMYESRF